MKTFIFDFDGTIADTLDLMVEIGNEMLTDLDLPTMGDEDLKKLRGMTIPEIVKYVKVPKHLLPQLAIKGRQLMTKRAKQVKPVKGMVEVLKQLEKDGVEMGIISSGSKEVIESFLKTYGLSGAFSFVDTGVSVFGKSRKLKSSVRRHKLDKSQTIYTGDEVRDIEAAKTSGLAIASVTWGLNNETLLAKKSPDFLVKTPKELLTLTK